MDARVVSDEVGAASAVKMAYAGWTKGTAALLLAIRELARAEGVEEALLEEWDLVAAGAARPLPARRPLGRREGLALGRGDGGDRRDLRGRGSSGRLPSSRCRGLPRPMSARRGELTRQAARLFAQKGYHGTSIGEIAEALGVQKELALRPHLLEAGPALRDDARGARGPSTPALDAIADELRPSEKIRPALRSHLRVVADQLDVATVFVQEWRYLEGARRDEIIGERRRYEERIRALFREGRELGELRSDLDEATAALLAPLGGELGVHLAAAGPRHRRARRPLLRAARRRDARLRDSARPESRPAPGRPRPRR